MPYNKSRVVRKPDFCICKKKEDADQLCGNWEADQRLCFRYTESTIPLHRKSQVVTIFSDCAAQFVSDQVGNPKTAFLTTGLIKVICDEDGLVAVLL